jgi:hypothetical protein
MPPPGSDVVGDLVTALRSIEEEDGIPPAPRRRSLNAVMTVLSRDCQMFFFTCRR